MSPADLQVPHTYRGFPRVSGDEPGRWDGGTAAAPFSPRERG